VALPFFAQFRTFDEAKEYCQKNSETLKFLKSTLSIDWDSQLGRELIETLVLSDSVSYF
jgi:hypothetical protein